MYTGWHYILVLVIVTILSSCSSAWNATKKAAQVVWDPSTPVGHVSERATLITLSMFAVGSVNPNSSGEPTPLEFVVFKLEDDSKFLAADFESLNDDFKASLGSNYVDHSDYTLIPSQFKFVDMDDIDEDVRYIGVAAKYNNPEVSQWKKVVKIKPIGHEYHLLLLFDENSVLLDKVE